MAAVDTNDVSVFHKRREKDAKMDGVERRRQVRVRKEEGYNLALPLRQLFFSFEVFHANKKEHQQRRKIKTGINSGLRGYSFLSISVYCAAALTIIILAVNHAHSRWKCTTNKNVIKIMKDIEHHMKKVNFQLLRSEIKLLTEDYEHCIDKKSHLVNPYKPYMMSLTKPHHIHHRLNLMNELILQFNQSMKTSNHKISSQFSKIQKFIKRHLRKGCHKGNFTIPTRDVLTKICKHRKDAELIKMLVGVDHLHDFFNHTLKDISSKLCEIKKGSSLIVQLKRNMNEVLDILNTQLPPSSVSKGCLNVVPKRYHDFKRKVLQPMTDHRMFANRFQIYLNISEKYLSQLNKDNRRDRRIVLLKANNFKLRAMLKTYLRQSCQIDTTTFKMAEVSYVIDESNLHDVVPKSCEIKEEDKGAELRIWLNLNFLKNIIHSTMREFDTVHHKD